MTELLFKGKKIADGAWITAPSVDFSDPDNVKVGGALVKPDSVCQFIGLFDVEGKRVFTGDILSVSLSTPELDMNVVITITPDARLQADRIIGGKFSDITAAKVARWKVIGNIHS